jgi:hypothetical protein
MTVEVCKVLDQAIAVLEKERPRDSEYWVGTGPDQSLEAAHKLLQLAKASPSFIDPLDELASIPTDSPPEGAPGN